MAQGRMLKRNISDSRRLAELNTDAARMLWTWIIPYLDVKGRYHAAPDMIKGKVVPRLKTFTEENIREYLDDMARVGLIVLYEDDGDKYLEFRKFEDFQTLQPKREGKPLPDPPKDKPTHGALTEHSSSTPAQYNINQVNLKEANIKQEAEQEQPVDNSSPLMASLKTILKKTEDRYPDPYEQQKIINFVKSNIRNRNHDAILHCLESLIKAPEKVKAIPQYLEAALKVEDGKYNAKDSEGRNNEFKRAVLPAPLKAILGMG